MKNRQRSQSDPSQMEGFGSDSMSTHISDNKQTPKQRRTSRDRIASIFNSFSLSSTPSTRKRDMDAMVDMAGRTNATSQVRLNRSISDGDKNNTSVCKSNVSSSSSSSTTSSSTSHTINEDKRNENENFSGVSYDWIFF